VSTIAESNERIAAAQRRMLARQVRIRADLLALKNSWGATLTQPWVVGGALVGGLMLSRRSRSVPVPVNCRCKSQGPSLLRSVATALVVPMIRQWMDAAREHPAATGASMAAPVEDAATAGRPAGT
jgi:hypothetical protein